MTKNKPEKRWYQQQIRMDLAQHERVLKYQKQILKETGVDVSFSQAVRSLLDKGLDVVVQTTARRTA